MGDTVTFTARVLPESTTVTGVSWWWYRLGSTTDSSQVCSTGLLTCPYTPDTSGTMRVRATLAGQAETAIATVTVATAPKQLELTCEPVSDTRGRPVTCTLSEKRGREFSVITSALTPTGGQLVMGTPIPSSAWQRLSGSKYTLSGPRVLDSRVEVDVLFTDPANPAALEPGSAVAIFTVQERTWFPPGTAPATVLETVTLPDRPPPGEARWPMAGTARLRIDASQLPALDRVTTGPNAGYAYLLEAPRMMAHLLEYSPALYGMGPWGADQNGQGTTPVGWSGMRWCDQADLDGYRSAVRQHELQHVAYNTDALSYSGPLFERVIVRASASPEYLVAALEKELSTVRSLATGRHRNLDYEDYERDPFKFEKQLGCEMDDDLQEP